MFNEDFKITGNVKFEMNGELIREVPNLVTTAGKGFVAASILKTTSNSPVAMTHMELGTGTTNPDAGDTTLETIVSGSRTAVATPSVSGAVVTYVCTFAAGTGTGALTEAGILNASSSGTLLCRTEFAVINKGANDAMTVTWTITVS
jgi:hypothetical protein